MNIIHILDEISKKNVSLVRVAQFISGYNFLTKKNQLITLDNKDKLPNIKTIKDPLSNFLYFSKIFFFLKKTKPEIIHIHGMWRSIYYGFILHGNFLNIPIIIQPHGMLLNAALKSKNRINYFFKTVGIKILQLINSKNISFIAVTKEEQLSILKYFPKNLVKIIPSPFIIYEQPHIRIKKKFVYSSN